jgi:hypothetical protein
MTRDELLFQLRSTELSLHTPEVDQFMQGQDAATRQRFVSLAFELHSLIRKLEQAQLAQIADKLDQLSGELEAGISDLQGTIDGISDATAVLGTLSTVLGLVARVVGFAGTI